MSKKNRQAKEQEKVVVVIAPTTLGRFKKQYLELTSSMVAQKIDKANIEARLDQRMKEDAMILGITLDEFKSQLASIKAKSSVKLSENKELFRGEFNHLLDNLLFSINATTDERVASSLQELLTYDAQYQSITGVVDSDRDDWRGLIVVAPFHSDTSKLSRYIGGWKDGSKNDRNQYSSGRRVPVAKSTGYTREQKLPDNIS
jgi:hypothetical protein